MWIPLKFSHERIAFERHSSPPAIGAVSGVEVRFKADLTPAFDKLSPVARLGRWCYIAVAKQTRTIARDLFRSFWMRKKIFHLDCEIGKVAFDLHKVLRCAFGHEQVLMMLYPVQSVSHDDGLAVLDILEPA